jgi:hypothetical protein
MRSRPNWRFFAHKAKERKMADIDAFAALLIEESKRFFEKYESSDDEDAKRAFLHASLLLVFCGLEAHINSVAEEFESGADITIHDKSVILEREVKLELGEFKLLNGLKMYPIDERLLFLYRRFSGKNLDRSSQWWSGLKSGLATRNRLSHPKSSHNVSGAEVRIAIESVIAAVNALFEAIYKRPLPSASMGLQSKLQL